MRTWGGRFSGETDPRAADFTRSVDLDRALVRDDIAGSIAHVRGLGRAGLLSSADVATITDGLLSLAGDAAADRLTWDPALEDVHMNVEAALGERVGPWPVGSTPGARATTRSRRTSGCGRDERSTIWMIAYSRSRARSSGWPSGRAPQ